MQRSLAGIVNTYIYETYVTRGLLAKSSLDGGDVWNLNLIIQGFRGSFDPQLPILPSQLVLALGYGGNHG